MSITRRPDPSEYAEYYGTYVGLVPDGDVLSALENQLERTEALFRSLDPERVDHRYAPKKWSAKEVLGHVVDAERVFSDRALRFSRRDPTELPGIDQDVLMAGAHFAGRSLESVLGEFHHLRLANIELFRSFDDEVLTRHGVASDCRFTVRALIYIIAGHELHHLGVLRERYDVG